MMHQTDNEHEEYGKKLVWVFTQCNISYYKMTVWRTGSSNALVLINRSCSVFDLVIVLGWVIAAREIISVSSQPSRSTQ